MVLLKIIVMVRTMKKALWDFKRSPYDKVLPRHLKNLRS